MLMKQSQPVVERRIMLVEDEAVVALDIRRRLKLLGYDVVGVSSTGEEAVAKAGELAPDLILMDIMLEGDMDGVQAASLIKERFNIAVVYLTAYADAETLDRAKTTDAFGYVIKPFEDRELHTTVEMALYKSNMESRLVENERRLYTTLRSIGEGVITVDGRDRVGFLNSVAEAVLGLPLEKAVNRELAEVFRLESLPNEAVEPVRDIHGNLLRTTTAYKILLTRDGGRIPIEVNASPMLDERNTAHGTVIVFKDISHRMRTEEALRRSVGELRLALGQTVNALAAASEKRDPYTAGHQERVSRLAKAICGELGLPGETAEGVRVAGLLHDIGKIAVPAEILSKPAVLTPVEMGIMKCHSEVGRDILKDIPFPRPVATMVLEHHERIDGSGYPAGLKGGDIMRESRILAVADVVEAMSSHRPYRAALGIEAALEEISNNKGRLYDPDAVDACAALFRDGRFSFDEET